MSKLSYTYAHTSAVSDASGVLYVWGLLYIETDWSYMCQWSQGAAWLGFPRHFQTSGWNKFVPHLTWKNIYVHQLIDHRHINTVLSPALALSNAFILRRAAFSWNFARYFWQTRSAWEFELMTSIPKDATWRAWRLHLVSSWFWCSHWLFKYSNLI